MSFHCIIRVFVVIFFSPQRPKVHEVSFFSYNRFIPSGFLASSCLYLNPSPSSQFLVSYRGTQPKWRTAQVKDSPSEGQPKWRTAQVLSLQIPLNNYRGPAKSGLHKYQLPVSVHHLLFLPATTSETSLSNLYLPTSNFFSASSFELYIVVRSPSAAATTASFL